MAKRCNARIVGSHINARARELDELHDKGLV
jgi:hypothetical protein